MNSQIVLAVACAAIFGVTLRTGGVAALTLLVISPAIAQTVGFVAIDDFAEYRIDGARRGLHDGANVRILDVTLRNKSEITTFPGTIQEVRWQGRTSGAEVRALKRDLTPFGMYDQTISPGQTVSVSYVIPDREDILGVTIDYPRATTGTATRSLSWAELGLTPTSDMSHDGGRQSASSRASATRTEVPETGEGQAN